MGLIAGYAGLTETAYASYNEFAEEVRECSKLGRHFDDLSRVRADGDIPLCDPDAQYEFTKHFMAVSRVIGGVWPHLDMDNPKGDSDYSPVTLETLFDYRFKYDYLPFDQWPRWSAAIEIACEQMTGKTPNRRAYEKMVKRLRDGIYLTRLYFQTLPLPSAQEQAAANEQQRMAQLYRQAQEQQEQERQRER